MRTIAGELDALLGDAPGGGRFALATVVRTAGSAPFPPGTAMAVTPAGAVLGGVSGGCVEAAVVEAAVEVLGTGRAEVLHFDPLPADGADPFAIGLACGGAIDVLVEALDPARWPALPAVLTALRDGRPLAVGTLIGGTAPPGTAPGAKLVVTPHGGALPPGSLGAPGLDAAVAADARSALVAGEPAAVRRYPLPGGEAEVLVQPFPPPPHLVVLGATGFAPAVARAGRMLGYRVTVCDARAVFATPERFPGATVVVDRPERFLARTPAGPDTAICVLTHDTDADVRLLTAALAGAAGYIGVIGNRASQQVRRERLRGAGVPEEALARVHAPMGLDLGARTPEETAISILAEIIAVRSAASARPLTRTGGPIHAAGAGPAPDPVA